jgi:hypothetical protein
MIIILIVIIFIIPILGDLVIFVLSISIWSLLFIIYFSIIKEGVDFIDEGEIKILIKVLNRPEVIDFVKKLIYEKTINKLRHIGIEIDANFNTSITQKKGIKMGTIRDKWLYNKIEEIYLNIINEKKTVAGFNLEI